MQNISHLLQTIQSLSAQLFVFRTNVEPLSMMKSLPPDIEALISDPVFEKMIDDCTGAASDLNLFLKPHLKRIHDVTHPKKKSETTVPYAPFVVDEPPIIHVAQPEQLDFRDILALEDIQPIKHRSDFPYKGNCRWCGAGSEYLYLNDGKRQYACKVCKHTFTDKVVPRGSSGYYCPHCKHKLTATHDRKGYIVYVCLNRKCSYYLNNKKLKDTSRDDELLTNSKRYRYHYHYREFKFNLDQIKSYSQQANSKVNLGKIHADERTLGLILTYYINYGLSARKVSNIMRDVHGIKISHQTIWNYGEAVAAVVKTMVDNYPYDMSSTQVGDETYIHVLGKNHYVFFFSDPARKFITSYYIFNTRDTENAVTSMWNVIHKFSSIPEDLEFITDGNPIYNAAQLFFELNGINFDLHQVIGVKNSDDVSKKYRPYKQTEERLNRTFKENYYPMCGFNSLEKANTYMVLYVAFFNFLRRHSALDYQPPVQLDCFNEFDLMPDKWLKLIEEASRYKTVSN